MTIEFTAHDLELHERAIRHAYKSDRPACISSVRRRMSCTRQ